MRLENILNRIHNFKIVEGIDDGDISVFFDKIGEDVFNFFPLKDEEKEGVIKMLFLFLKNQDPEMEENFSFIHLIEGIDKPTYEIYNKELIKFNKLNGTLISILLFNRYLNSLDEKNCRRKLKLFKLIGENINYSGLIKEEALRLYENQIKRLKLSEEVKK